MIINDEIADLGMRSPQSDRQFRADRASLSRVKRVQFVNGSILSRNVDLGPTARDLSRRTCNRDPVRRRVTMVGRGGAVRWKDRHVACVSPQKKCFWQSQLIRADNPDTLINCLVSIAYRAKSDRSTMNGFFQTGNALGFVDQASCEQYRRRFNLAWC
jgi:hypothetical protein